MMSSTNEDDPFLQVQGEVLTTLSTTRPLFTSYLRIRSLPSTSPNPSPELLSARADLTTSLSSLAEDLSDLSAAVQAVQSDPYRYGLEIEEVARRKRLVEELGGEIEDMREELARPIAQSANTNSNSNSYNNSNGKSNARSYESTADGDAGPDPNSDAYAAFEQQQQLHMMAEQDTTLDSVFHTVGNIRRQADTMGRELEEQREMLEHVDTLADRVGGRLSTGMKSMGTIVRRNEDGLSSCCIGALILVLCILLVLLLIL